MSVILKATERIENIDKDSIPGPVKVDIFPTQKCNLDCNFCEFPSVDPEEYKKELATEKILEIIDHAADLGAQTFGIIGGEPFVRSDMIDIMEQIKKHDMNGSITTNGTLLTNSKIDRISEIGWDLLRISIDGLADTHDELRGKKGSFLKIKRALDYFETKKNKTTIEINTVLNKKNYKEIPELVEFASNYQINKIILLPVIEFNTGSRQIKVDNKLATDVAKSLANAKDIAEKNEIMINTDQVIEDELYDKSNETDMIISDYDIPCFVPWYSLSINAKGIATPCSQFKEDKGIDVRGKSLQEIWVSKKFEEIRRNIINKELPETCSKCCAPLLEENKEIRERLENKEKLISIYK